ncbi:MAG: hypothetical protein JST68_12865 [Bacteroidetes bacterium]|nr:hypothetical protein [Bacteroidota bacterium]
MIFILIPSLIVIGVLAILSRRLFINYRTEVRDTLRQSPANTSTESPTPPGYEHLPEPIRRYIHAANLRHPNPIKNFRVNYTGRLRSAPRTPWLPCSTEQYNVIEPATRLFFLRSRKKGLPIAGFHSYKQADKTHQPEASMDIRLLSLFPVEQQSGPYMAIAETVTFFNDLCLLAPSCLADPRIQWEPVDCRTVNARFTLGDVTIGATLCFNEDGHLSNFISSDRYYTTPHHRMVRTRWSTPITSWHRIDGHILPAAADLIWHLPEGDFCYGRFALVDIEYNVDSFT